MGHAQQAIAYAQEGSPPSPPPISPPYADPLSPEAKAQFEKLISAIGHAIGIIAVHETGHQLNLPMMDCDGEYGPRCGEDYLYENFASSSNHEWFYVTLPGKEIRWSQRARCALQKYLLGKGYTSHDPTCR
jgi:hypothetical protein